MIDDMIDAARDHGALACLGLFIVFLLPVILLFKICAWIIKLIFD